MVVLCWFHRVLPAHVDGYGDGSNTSDLQLLCAVAKRATFQLSRGWEGVSNVLRFHGKVPYGKSVVLIGNYAGGENAIFTALQKTVCKGKSAALCGLFGRYLVDVSDDESDRNLLQHVSKDIVDTILLRDCQHLWGDQVLGIGRLGIVQCFFYFCWTCCCVSNVIFI